MKFTYKLIVLWGLLVLGIFSVLAVEQPASHTIVFDDVQVTYSTDIANNVSLSVFSNDTNTQNQFDLSHIGWLTLSFYNETYPPALPEIINKGHISIYRLRDYADNADMQSVVSTLKELVNTQTDLIPYTALNQSLPYFPILMHGQVVRARPEYITTDAIEGIGYITAVQAAAEPFLADSFYYTFQGLSVDGAYYVSANFPLIVDKFPRILPQDFDVDAFSETHERYLMESADTLNQTDDIQVTPTLTSIQALIRSIHFVDLQKDESR